MTETTPQVERHFHWEFIAWDEMNEHRAYMYAVAVTVLGYESEADARIGCRQVVARKNYTLNRVWECSSCGYQGQVLQTMQTMTDKM